MSKEPVVLTRAAHKVIDEYLSKVRHAMETGGAAPTQVRSVLADLEGQILEMLAGRGATAHEPDVRAVLAALDTPEDYAEESAASAAANPRIAVTCSEPQQPARLSRVAVTGAALASMCFCLSIPLFFHVAGSAVEGARAAQWKQLTNHTQPAPIPLTVLLTPVFSASLFLGMPAMLLGFAAISRIHHSRRQLYGLPLAYIGAWTLPLLWLTLVVAALPAGIVVAAMGNRVGGVPVAVLIWIGVILALVIDVKLIGMLCRAVACRDSTTSAARGQSGEIP